MESNPKEFAPPYLIVGADDHIGPEKGPLV